MYILFEIGAPFKQFGMQTGQSHLTGASFDRASYTTLLDSGLRRSDD